MKNGINIKHSYLNKALRLLVTTVLLLLTVSTYAAKPFNGFDHFSTGFPLTGKHEFIDCSSCHLDGKFKGAPLDCGLCHNGIRAPGKHQEHFASNNVCDDCHTVDSWKGAKFDHNDVQGPCQNCHNNSIAMGKSPSHILSSPACEDCHNTIVFEPVTTVDHAAVIGSCNSCHNCLIATGMTPQHIVTNDQCDACHSTTSWNNVRFDHNNITAVCSSCHNGVTATGKHPSHIQTTAECDDCHNTSTWLGAAFSHATVTGVCSSCHNGVTATSKHPAHLLTTGECDDCHNSTTTWLGASFDHSVLTGLCSSCHNGSTATGKNSTHFFTTLDCDRCHTTARWLPLELFRHDSPDFPGDHRTATLCVDCHTTNNQVIAWPFTAYKPECAGCHANDYKADSHKGSGDIPIPIFDVQDCSGSCHLKDGDRSNEHFSGGSEW